MSGVYHCVLLLCGLVVVFGDLEEAEGGKCDRIKLPLCQDLGYNWTAMPNLMGHVTQKEAEEAHSLTGHSGKVMAAKFLGEPTKVVTGSHDRTLKIWDLRSKMCTETKFAGSSCNDLVTSDGAGSTLISGHFDKSIRFWDIRKDTSANQIVLQGKVTSLDLSRDSNYLLACVRDDTIQLIDLRMNTITRSFSHESFKVGCDWSRAAFGPGGRLLAVGGADGNVHIWNTHSGKLEATLKEHIAAVTAVSWHPQSGLLASVDRGKKAVIWGDL